MSRLFILTALAVSLTAAGVAAQPHTAGWSFTSGASNLAPIFAGRVDMTGKVSTLLTLSQLPQNVYSDGGTLDYDDRNYVIALLSKVINGSLLQFDRSGTILQTIQVLATNPQMGGGMTHDVDVDQNGDFLVAVGQGAGPGNTGLFKVDRSNKVTTISKSSLFQDIVAVVPDVVSGNHLVLDRSVNGILSVAPDGSAVTSIGKFGVSVGQQIAQHKGSGDLYVGAFSSSGAVILRMDLVGTASTFLASGLYSGRAVFADRSSAAAPRLTVGSVSTSAGFYFVDLATKAITTLVTTPNLGPNQVFPDREVGSLLRSPGRWEISLHFAGQVGNGYAIGLSLSGVQPGVGLPDGRRIFLNVDNLTALSLNGLLGPIFTKNLGNLNVVDRATAVLDVSGFPGLKGIPVWVQVVTLNPSAPLGIHTVADPLRITL